MSNVSDGTTKGTGGRQKFLEINAGDESGKLQTV